MKKFPCVLAASQGKIAKNRRKGAQIKWARHTLEHCQCISSKVSIRTKSVATLYAVGILVGASPELEKRQILGLYRGKNPPIFAIFDLTPRSNKNTYGVEGGYAFSSNRDLAGNTLSEL